MLRQIRKLLAEPGFRAEPLAVTARAVAWAGYVATKKTPVFSLGESGARLSVPPDMRFTSLTAFLLRDWTEPELRRLLDFVRPGSVFVDVGANIGLYTLKAATVAGRVIAIEPGAEAGALLRSNVALNGFDNVTVVAKALSDSVGRATLHHVAVGEDPQAFSLLSDPSAVAGESVPTTTLDALAGELALPRVDCIKMDVEGAEDRVIAGGTAVLGRDRPVVIFEANCPTLRKSGGRVDAAWNGLKALGYEFFLLQDARLEKTDRFPDFGDGFGNIVAKHPANPRG